MPEEMPAPCPCPAGPRAVRWRERLPRAARVYHGIRLSGFSTSDSDFTPHWNAAFGCTVRSLDHMKHLQRQHGVSDVVVKGDGAERNAPRDITRRIRRHADFAEQVATGKSFETGRGVAVEFVDPEEDVE
jgi:hypothetical protein